MFKLHPTSSIAVIVSRSNDAELTMLGIAGELTQHTRDDFKTRVIEELSNSAALVSRSVQMKFLLDFTHCTDVDSQGMAVIVATAKRIREAGGMVRATGLNGDIAELFRLTKLDQIISIDATPAVTSG